MGADTLGGCTRTQVANIVSGSLPAAAWVDRAVTALDQFIAQPTAPTTLPTRIALFRHFTTLDPSSALYIRGYLAAIGDWLRHALASPSMIDIDCQPSFCGASTIAYVGGHSPPVHFCPAFLSAPLTEGAKVTLIHEVAHLDRLGSAPLMTVGHDFLSVEDVTYADFRLYPRLSTGQALQNAESYAEFVKEIATGQGMTFGVPADSVQGCTPAQDGAIRQALARGQQAAQRAHNASDAPTRMAPYLTYIGSTPADLATFKAASERVFLLLSRAVAARCGGPTDSGCTTNFPLTFSRTPDSLNVCPMLWVLPERNQDRWILAGLYGLLGGQNTWAAAWQYAFVAQDIAEQEQEKRMAELRQRFP